MATRTAVIRTILSRTIKSCQIQHPTIQHVIAGASDDLCSYIEKCRYAESWIPESEALLSLLERSKCDQLAIIEVASELIRLRVAVKEEEEADEGGLKTPSVVKMPAAPDMPVSESVDVSHMFADILPPQGQDQPA